MTEVPIISKPINFICKANQWTGFYLLILEDYVNYEHIYFVHCNEEH